MTVSPSLPVDAARAALVRAMQRMQAAGLNRGTSGNAAIRVPGGMVVTPSGVAPDQLSDAAMVFVSDDGEVAVGGMRPSSEWRMHHYLLRARPDAGAVMHCHSRHATILACCNRAIEPIHYMILTSGAPRIPVAPFAVFGTEAIAELVVAAMGAGRACLMAHHGQVTLGGTWEQALSLAEEVEEQAAITYGALLIGGAPQLADADLAASTLQFQSYGQKHG